MCWMFRELTYLIVGPISSLARVVDGFLIGGHYDKKQRTTVRMFDGRPAVNSPLSG